MTAQLDPAKRARVAQLRGGAPATADAAGRKSTGTAPAPSRTETNLDALPPTGAGAQPAPRSNPLGSFFDKIKNAVPTSASGAAPTPTPEPP